MGFYIKGKKYKNLTEIATEYGIPKYSAMARIKSSREAWKDWTDTAPKKATNKKKVKHADG